MAKAFERKVLGVTRSPMNSKRWMLTLECGHEVWVTSSRQPIREFSKCHACHTLSIAARDEKP